MAQPFDPVADENMRRRRIVRIPAKAMLDIFNHNQWDYLALPTFPKLPPDYQVQAVHYRWESDEFALMVWSIEFPPVALGAPIPTLPMGDALMTMKAYRKTPE